MAKTTTETSSTETTTTTVGNGFDVKAVDEALETLAQNAELLGKHISKAPSAFGDLLRDFTHNRLENCEGGEGVDGFQVWSDGFKPDLPTKKGGRKWNQALGGSLDGLAYVLRAYRLATVCILQSCQNTAAMKDQEAAERLAQKIAEATARLYRADKLARQSAEGGKRPNEAKHATALKRIEKFRDQLEKLGANPDECLENAKAAAKKAAAKKVAAKKADK